MRADMIDRWREGGRTREGRIEIGLVFPRHCRIARSIGCFCTPGIIRAATLTMSHKGIVQYHVSERDQTELRCIGGERENGTARRCN